MDHLISGGGGLRKMYLNNLFIFSQFGNKIFYFTSSVFFVHRKDETIFYSTYFCEPTGHTVSFDDNMSNSVGSLVM